MNSRKRGQSLGLESASGCAKIWGGDNEKRCEWVGKHWIWQKRLGTLSWGWPSSLKRGLHDRLGSEKKSKLESNHETLWWTAQEIEGKKKSALGISSNQVLIPSSTQEAKNASGEIRGGLQRSSVREKGHFNSGRSHAQWGERGA